MSVFAVFTFEDMYWFTRVEERQIAYVRYWISLSILEPSNGLRVLQVCLFGAQSTY